SDPAEQQADRIGAQIGRDLASTTVSDGVLGGDAASIAEGYLGVGLAGTRIEAGHAGQRKARDESALAVTEGSEISFAEGKFDSSTLAGRELLGHELVHVAQQRRHGIGAARQNAKPDHAEEGSDSSREDPKPVEVLTEELVAKMSEE